MSGDCVQVSGEPLRNALDVMCPWCNAPPTKVCVVAPGVPLSVGVHESRLDAYAGAREALAQQHKSRESLEEHAQERGPRASSALSYSEPERMKAEVAARVAWLANACGWTMRPCRSCGVPLVFIPTVTKIMPVEQATLAPHWGYCPNADKHRRTR